MLSETALKIWKTVRFGLIRKFKLKTCSYHTTKFNLQTSQVRNPPQKSRVLAMYQVLVSFIPIWKWKLTRLSLYTTLYGIPLLRYHECTSAWACTHARTRTHTHTHRAIFYTHTFLKHPYLSPVVVIVNPSYSFPWSLRLGTFVFTVNPSRFTVKLLLGRKKSNITSL